MAKVHGSCDPRFRTVQDIFQSYFDSGEQLGASISVNLDGQEVVDLWGGHADPARTRPWERDTVTTAWSTTKCITALAVYVLIERGLVSPTDKVSKYWPEFAANGKQDVQVRHIMSHTSGVAGWDDVLSLEQVCDLPYATSRLAQQPPWWTPGTRSGYHSITYGHLNGELVRRVTGKSLRQFVAEDLAAPLDAAADFSLGAPPDREADWPRIVAEMVPPPAMDGIIAPTPPGDETAKMIAAKALRSPPPDANVANTDTFRRAELGAVNGHANARGVVRLLRAVALAGSEHAPKGLDGKPLLSRETVERIFEEQAHGVDLVTAQTMRIGLGFGLADKDSQLAGWLPGGDRMCYWGGWGGSMGIMDVERRLTVSYVMNKMDNVGFGNGPAKALVAAVYEVLDGAV